MDRRGVFADGGEDKAALIKRQQKEFQELWRQGADFTGFGDTHVKMLSRKAQFWDGSDLVAEVEVEVEFVKNHRLMEWGALWALVIAGRCMTSALEPLIEELAPGPRDPLFADRTPFALRSRLDPDFMPPMNRDGNLSVVADSDIATVVQAAREGLATSIVPMLLRYRDGDPGVIDDVLRREGRGYRAPAKAIAAVCILNKDLARFESVSATKRFKRLVDVRGGGAEALGAQVRELVRPVR